MRLQVGRVDHDGLWPSIGHKRGTQADAFVKVEQKLRTGDRIQCTRNNYAAKQLSGRTAEVLAIDPTKASSWSA